MNAYVNKEIPDVLQSQCGINCLTDICHYSFNEFRQQVSDHLSWSETNRLYCDAQQEQKENQLYEARILKRANPQLQNAVHLGITLPHAELRSYNNEFGSRASQYVAPGSVSSMFSPAAYLTELYREARNLHASDSVYHLDERRPDLQSMELNQQNMDTELSTLSLSNEILLKGIKANKSNLDSDTKVMEMLSTFRPSGTIPYHDAYENVRKAIQLQDPKLEQFQKSPAVAGLMHQASLLGINNSISPELLNILTEEITEANADEIYKKNFGDIDPTWLAMPEYLKSYYNFSDEELSQFIHKYPNNELNAQKIHLLKINKIILLSRAVNLPILKIDEIVPEQNITPTILGKIFLVKYYMQKYNIDTENSLILCNAPISQYSYTQWISRCIAAARERIPGSIDNYVTGVRECSQQRSNLKDDGYNKRYSTWAGISQLIYYPENYIDPTMRIGQTKMMDTLLQSVSQSQLNADTVEDAFKSYLTSFEQVANLEVISAYHDNVNNDQGLTYFIGHSKTEVNQYYWRSVDHSKFNDGKFSANAWSEWNKIDCAINPYQSTIRPVIYKSRLYLIWLEQKETAKQDKDNKVITDYHYELKLAHIRYDGTWNVPITFDVNEKILALELTKSQAPGLYCAGYQGEDTLLVMFYSKKEKLDDYKTAPMQGLYIFSDMSSKDMTNEQCNSYRNNGYTHFDTNSIIRINNRYAEDYEIPSLMNHSNSHDWGKYNLSQVYGGSIVINYTVASSDLKINISPKLRIIHDGKEGRERIQCNLIKKYGKLGDKFIIYTNINKNPNHSKNEKLIYPVYQYRNNEKGRLLFYRSNTTGTVRAWFPTTKEEITTTTSSNQDCIIDKINNTDLFKSYFYTRHLSSCLFVGCTRSPRSHSYLCSRGFTPLPSRCILKSIGYIWKIKKARLPPILVDQ
ncbi:neuraminidase-like domain-containing protein [Photorhabdus bodei]|uniref:neuraminidase-like domain-containing protein n=1 Tax=Photorhabdus TaxID=29487 RepID=UPI001E508901|nr:MULTISPECIES: neuraminidase-like domain-containing protein [Photorhabdus]MCT8351807.1 Tc toxin subunit A [Photorhabdus kayaii]MDB6367599.1 neuraminidase-like domain-containing protein [Photorhabdus bodei]